MPPLKPAGAARACEVGPARTAVPEIHGNGRGLGPLKDGIVVLANAKIVIDSESLLR
jgi:hypothetical protein